MGLSHWRTGIPNILCLSLLLPHVLKMPNYSKTDAIF